MGKKLIIKGADFSTNAVEEVTWYIDVTDSGWATNPGTSASAGWSYPASQESAYIGQPINAIKVKNATAGVMTIYKVSELGQAGTLLATINVTQANVLTTYVLPTTVTINSGEHLVFHDSTDTAFFRYKQKSGSTFIKRAQYSNYSTVSGYELSIGVGYYG